MYRARKITDRLVRACKRSPVILLGGARQTGKTTLVQHLSEKDGYAYISFDDIRYLSAAKNDPLAFLSGIKKPVILDEIQRVPELFLPIKHEVDQIRIPGRYVLTGSANPLLLPKIGDSLAGRIEILKLYPFSRGEILGVEEHFIDALFSDSTVWEDSLPLSREELIDLCLNGGYPQIVDLQDFESKEAWFQSYLTTLLEKDITDLAHIEGLSQIPNILKLLATRVGNLLNRSELGRTAGIPTTTLNRYLQLLNTLYLIDLLPPWHINLGKRLVKSPKTYLLDTGILSYLIGLDRSRLLSNSQRFGSILENYVLAELRKQMSWAKTSVSLSHYRSASGVEVDLVLENRAGEMVGIEIKGSSSVDFAFFKGLSELQELAGERFLTGIVLYTGEKVIPFGRRLWALPIQSLWGRRR